MNIESIGGRKFIGFVLLISASIAVEVYAKAGLTTTMAAFLGTLYTAYAATNAIITTKTAAAASEQPERRPEAQQPVSDDIAQHMAGTLSQIGSALNTLQQGQGRGEQALQIVQQSLGTLQKAVGSILLDKQG